MTANVHIRWMIRRDMPSVIDIENNSFAFPWSEDDFMQCLRQRNSIGMVAEVDDRLAGFMIYELNKSQIYLLDFAVDPAFRRCGVGTAMIGKLTSKLSCERRNLIMLHINEENLRGQMFFRASGFKAIGTCRNFYVQPVRDAYAMEYRYVPDVHEIAELYDVAREAV